MAGLALLLFLVPGTISSDSELPDNPSQFIDARPLSLTRAMRESLANGALQLVAGWELDGANSDFGGFSAVHAMGNDRFLLLSDYGVLAGFTLGGKGGTHDSFVAPLPVKAGDGEEKWDKDSEGMTFDPISRRFWVSFEHRNAVRRYAPAFARAEMVGRPAQMKKWSGNGGAEAIVRLSDGRFLVFSESVEGPNGGSMALLYDSDPAEPGAVARIFGFDAPEGFLVTDAAQLPDGRVLVLHRSVTIRHGWRAMLSLFDPGDIVAGRAVRPLIVARLAAPLPIDNMEGLAIEAKVDGLHAWLVSDDNFSTIQRTVLLDFRLDPEKLPKPEQKRKKARNR